MFCAHTCSFLRPPFLIFFFLSLCDSVSAWHHSLSALSVCICVCIWLKWWRTYITRVGSYQGRQSHGCDPSVWLLSDLFVVLHEKHKHHKVLQQYRSVRGYSEEVVQPDCTHTQKCTHLSTHLHNCTHSSWVPSGSNKAGWANSELLVRYLPRVFVYWSTQALPWVTMWCVYLCVCIHVCGCMHNFCLVEHYMYMSVSSSGHQIFTLHVTDVLEK